MSEHDPRQSAVKVVHVLQEAGYVAYLAGGCVRDELLGQLPKDYDVATDAPPESVGALFRRTRAVGRSFGVMQVRMHGQTIEVATFRQEHGYTDKRRPDRVTFCDAASDAQRRDFTINALFIDPLDERERKGGRIIDLVGGVADLEAGIIRAVGEPEARLQEDHLRALRAVRFTARLGFHLEEQTARAIQHYARELAGVSRERIGDELRLMLGHPRRAGAVSLMHALGLDGPVLREPAQGERRLELMQRLPREASFTMALAAWAMDRLTHPDEQSVPAARLLAAAPGLKSHWRASLCLSNEETRGLFNMLEGVAEVEQSWGSWAVARRKRFAAMPDAAAIVELIETRHRSVGGSIRAQIEALGRTASGIAPVPLITGDDLVAIGLSPGPRFQEWLSRVYDAQLEDRIASRDEALGLIRAWWRGEAEGQ